MTRANPEWVTISKLDLSRRPTRTVLPVEISACESGSSVIIRPCSAICFPATQTDLTVTFSISSRMTKSASRPGARAPLFFKPKCKAVLIVAILKASIGSTPQAIARRTTLLICPLASTSSGEASSVHRQKNRLFLSVTVRLKTETFCPAEPSRIKIVIPRLIRSWTSFSVLHSWSLSTPLKAYADNSAPEVNGLWPSINLP